MCGAGDEMDHQGCREYMRFYDDKFYCAQKNYNLREVPVDSD